MRYLLDTDVVSYIVRGRPSVFRERVNVIPDGQLGISVITLAEVLMGLRKLPPDHRLIQDTRDFLDRLAIFPWTIVAAVAYADIADHLRRIGQPIGPMDTLIAAHAIALGATLVTGNVRHHDRVPGLKIENWRESVDQ